MPAAMETSVAVSTGETIHYRRREGGEIPVVLLHGNNSSSIHWDVVFERMDDRFDLVAMDMRGFGDSSYEGVVDAPDELLATVEPFLDVPV